MNLEPKILLSIAIPSILTQNKERVKINWEKSTQNNADIIIAKGNVEHLQRIPAKASRRLKISEFAYDYFISNEIPSSYDKRIAKGRNWSDLTQNEKLNFHLNILSEGNQYSFEILN